MPQQIPLSALNEINPYLFEIPKSFRADMRVPARVYVAREMLDEIANDRSLWQLINTSTLPGIQEYALAMPDIHEGYGFPIGGVVATDAKDGVISPGGVGYDINCGVRVLTSTITKADIKNKIETIANQIFRDVPSGVGRGGDLILNTKEIDAVLTNGVRILVEWGYAREEDLEAIESYGHLEGADASCVSNKAKGRGRDQLGTLGSGNHFLEIQEIEKIYEPEIAKAWGLTLGGITIFIHTGSRGLGHQTCTDHVRVMVRKLDEWGIDLPDRELACAPLNSSEGQNYLEAMRACANYAWANRQLINHRIRNAWTRVLGDTGGELRLLYDVAHNVAKIEKHKIKGKHKEVCVHRKGAIRAFPAGHPELPTRFQKTGQPVLIPGTMGTSSYILVGTESAMIESFGSVCHGAGRRMSRKAAKQTVSGHELRVRLAKQGIYIKCESDRGLAEEGPHAYKDVDIVVKTCEKAGLAKRVAKLKPLAVIKGG